jgi:hypothetical protein
MCKEIVARMRTANEIRTSDKEHRKRRGKQYSFKINTEIVFVCDSISEASGVLQKGKISIETIRVAIYFRMLNQVLVAGKREIYTASWRERL